MEQRSLIIVPEIISTGKKKRPKMIPKGWKRHPKWQAYAWADSGYALPRFQKFSYFSVTCNHKINKNES